MLLRPTLLRGRSPSAKQVESRNGAGAELEEPVPFPFVEQARELHPGRSENRK
jgi:hypothetical protein